MVITAILSFTVCNMPIYPLSLKEVTFNQIKVEISLASVCRSHAFSIISCFPVINRSEIVPIVCRSGLNLALKGKRRLITILDHFRNNHAR